MYYNIRIGGSMSRLVKTIKACTESQATELAKIWARSYFGSAGAIYSKAPEDIVFRFENREGFKHMTFVKIKCDVVDKPATWTGDPIKDFCLMRGGIDCTSQKVVRSERATKNLAELWSEII